MLWKKSCRVGRIKLVVNTKTINTYKNLQSLNSPLSIHLCFPLGTATPCFLSEKVNRADPRTVQFDNFLKLWATKVIQVFYILSEKSGQQSTLFKALSKHFCNHHFYVVKDSKELIIIQFSATPRNST